MKDARTSTSSQKLASTFGALVGSPEADITAFSIVRHEPFLTGNNRDIPVSVQELVYGRKEAGVRTSAKKDRGASEGLDTHFLQRTRETEKILVEKPKHFVRGPEELAQGKDNSPVEAPQAFTSKNMPQKVPNKANQAPKSNYKGKKKAKSKWNRPYPQNYRAPKKGKKAVYNMFNMERTLMEFRYKEEEIMNQSFPKK
ncbi:hypothetical protein O181_040392 [Austropuccinia psidii MF-1]|uniref:Uncharacterized protein n=1 Tax=Austropuccinia psidii MF-1 TaxID=1389203 RepID=A0A9Q3DEQ8_9BASI|nr:hypothetical protein [Austropuccinia psidii MF-1]